MEGVSCNNILADNQHPFYRVSVSAQVSVLVLTRTAYKDRKGRDVRKLLLADNQHQFYRPRKSYNWSQARVLRKTVLAHNQQPFDRLYYTRDHYTRRHDLANNENIQLNIFTFRGKGYQMMVDVTETFFRYYLS